MKQPMQNVPQVYLDSSDFSVLSDPRRLDAKIGATLDTLLKYADSGLVQFRFSMAHVSEIAPIAPHAQEAAERRAQLMYRLCGAHTLVSIEEIIDAELSCFSNFSACSEGRWYPPIDDLLPQTPFTDMARLMDADLKTMGLTRAQRRQKKREIFKRGRFTKQAQERFDASREQTTAEILGTLPFEPAEVQALMSYVREGSGRDTVSRAFHRILGDPTWIMGRFAAAPDSLTGIAAWLREGGSKFLQSMEASLSGWHELFRQRREQETLGLASIESVQDPATKKALLNEHAARQRELEKTASRMRAELDQGIFRRFAERPGSNPALAALPSDDFKERCPGIACSVSAGLHATKRAMLEVHPRQVKASDFGDAMHAFYAPYVDIYRTDAFMADGLAHILAKCGTRLAPRLHDVPALIDQMLV
jgi:hypothetical protein